MVFGFDGKLERPRRFTNKDLDEDGQVGVSDILQVLAQFGEVC